LKLSNAPIEVVSLPENGSYCYSITQTGLEKLPKSSFKYNRDNFELYQLQLDDSYEHLYMFERNHIMVNIAGTAVPALIDTGAGINAIPRDMLKQLLPDALHKSQSSRVRQCKLADGNIVMISRMVNINVEIGQYNHHLQVHVLEQGRELILGLEFLQSVQGILDCNKGILHVRQDKRNSNINSSEHVCISTLQPIIDCVTRSNAAGIVSLGTTASEEIFPLTYDKLPIELDYNPFSDDEDLMIPALDFHQIVLPGDPDA